MGIHADVCFTVHVSVIDKITTYIGFTLHYISILFVVLSRAAICFPKLCRLSDMAEALDHVLLCKRRKRQ